MSPTSRSTEKDDANKATEEDVVETRADEKLVEEAVDFIHKTIAETLDKGITTIGDYLLERFYNNDPDRVRSRNPHKEKSFRSLVERCETPELPISKTGLHRAVSAAVMRRTLPAGAAFKLLPPSHQAMLLPLRDPEKVEKFAQRAVNKQMSVRGLHDIVVEEVANARQGEPRGRKPLPVIVKTLSRSLKIFTFEGGRRSFTKTMVEELDEDQRKSALKSALGLQASLTKLIEKLEAKG